MSALHESLADFASAIVSGHELPRKTQAVCPNYSTEIALDIYRNNYFGNLHDALSYAYPVTEKLVGKDFFRYLAMHYIARHPSASGNLHHYGAEMADFIAGFESARGLIYLADVATLEWAYHRAYFACDAGRLDVIGLSKVPQERYADLILNTHPSCQLVRSNYPIAAIWNAHQPNADCDFHITLDGRSCNVLVNRKDNAVLIRELSDAAATWLQQIQSGASLGKATDAALERGTDLDLNVLLPDLVESRALTYFTLRNTS